VGQWGLLGLARPPKIPTYLVERCIGQHGIGRAQDRRQSNRCVFYRLLIDPSIGRHLYIYIRRLVFLWNHKNKLRITVSL